MSIRNILVAVEDGAAGQRRVEAAMGWARALDAHLTGLYAIPRVIPAAISNHTGIALGTQAESFEMERQLKRRRQENRTRALECERRFLGIAEQSAVDASWALASDDVLGALAQHALYADLVVVGQADKRNAELARGALPDELVVLCGCPLLVIPPGGAVPVVGERIVVAWHRDPQAKRTLHSALPLLRCARHVEVLTVDGKSRELEEGIPMERAVLGYLAWHGISSEFRSIPQNGRIGEALLSRVSETHGDLIVMGAYHHSRLRQALLGGVTRHVLRNAQVPVLIAH